MSNSFISEYQVYYEDTDAAGIVYYANYLKFAERARTDALRTIGINQKILLAKDGLGFVVHHLEAAFKAPAELEDRITIQTSLIEVGKVRMRMKQELLRGEVLLVQMMVDIAMVDAKRKPARIPEDIVSKLKERI